MANKLEIKNRIRSVDSTKKITKAMQLVAASKLRKQKDLMDTNRTYAMYLQEVVEHILSTIKTSDHPFLKRSQTEKRLIIVYTSDMGLCGGYNANTYKLLESSINEGDEVIIVGSRGTTYLKRRDLNIIETKIGVSEEGYEDILDIAELALKQYTSGVVGSIEVLYTKFVNSMDFEPQLERLLPATRNEELEKDVVKQDVIFEPAGDAILDELIPLYLKSLLYSRWIETKTSEQASRQNAMENATDNAQELRDELELKFNQARQASITQEITEIVGGANAQ